MARAWYAASAYLLATLVATWPLAAGLGRDVAWDLGDSVLNMWILSWVCEQFRHILTGDVSRIATFFDANAFYPAPLALAYSEHLVAQAVQVFPIYVATANPILCYNLLFLSTYVLAGLGMYLLVRELTGHAWGAFVAGLLFAFAPYRLAQSSHLQVLSAQWMPFVFYGLVRFFRSAAAVGPVAKAGAQGPALRMKPLVGASAALVAQGLSCGYYLLFFTPVAAAFALSEIARGRLWRSARAWIALGGAALLAAALLTPFLLPYAALRTQGFGVRSLAEVTRFSADVYSYATAFEEQRLWGRVLRAFPKPEGELFSGAVPLLLALIGIFGGAAYADSALRTPSVRRPGPAERTRRLGPRWLTWLLSAAATGHAAAAALVLLYRRISIDLGPLTLRMSNINQLLLRAAIALALLFLVSPAARARAARFARDRGFFVVMLAGAVWLSLGPAPQSLGRPVEIAAPYRLLFEAVPGFDGLRVPARLAMVAAFALAVLGGYGAAALSRTRAGRMVVAALAGVFLLEATHVPFLVNGVTPLRSFNTPEARLYRPARAPAVYARVRDEPADSVLVELPLGPPDFDLRAMYYSTVHWRPVVNGYSGFTPPHYPRLVTALSEIPRHPEVALAALRASGATYAIVHEAAYLGDEGPAVSMVLRSAGAVALFRDSGDVLFHLPR
ncbi:MAG: hypothetical protein A3F70_17015 [Acidobacteria bacterium RIFCSPLOWO2_12_FULL_67_14]|nr:MAG: hypothetical protein A3F70_17015 [Acidobacteria bacterium RIFCSPLOWO2_12_FULL_67_14]